MTAYCQRLHEAAAKLRLTAIDLLRAFKMKIDDSQPIVGTYQGVWPGIQVEEGGTAKAAPSGAPWINTNSGFLRFMRSATTAPLWIGVRPPEDEQDHPGAIPAGDQRRRDCRRAVDHRAGRRFQPKTDCRRGAGSQDVGSYDAALALLRIARRLAGQ